MNAPAKPGGVGLFGGTFNPIHFGHLRAAEEVAEALGLERVLFIPCATPPHKREADGDPLASARERLAWVERALRGNPRFAVDPLEIERGGASYSVDTVRALRERLGTTPVFLIGSDAFRELGTWRDPGALLRLAHFAVVTRPPETGTLPEWLAEPLAKEIEWARDGRSGRHRDGGPWLRLVAITALDISSSAIRRRLREGRSVRYLLPEDVREAVEASRAYEAPRS